MKDNDLDLLFGNKYQQQNNCLFLRCFFKPDSHCPFIKPGSPPLKSINKNNEKMAFIFEYCFMHGLQ